MTDERLQFFKDVSEQDTVIQSRLVKELLNEIEDLEKRLSGARELNYHLDEELDKIVGAGY